MFVVQDGQGGVRAGQDGHRRRQVLRGLSGVKEGDAVVTGPFASVRELADGAAVKVEPPAPTTPARKP